MTNLRKSFILLSAAITMGNLREAQAAAKKAGPTPTRPATAPTSQASKQGQAAKSGRVPGAPRRRIVDAALAVAALSG